MMDRNVEIVQEYLPGEFLNYHVVVLHRMASCLGVICYEFQHSPQLDGNCRSTPNCQLAFQRPPPPSFPASSARYLPRVRVVPLQVGAAELQ